MFTVLAAEGLTALWVVLGIAVIGGIAFLIYYFVPGIRPEKKELDENQIAKEELDRFLVPMDEENVEIKPEDDSDEDEKKESK